MVILLLLNTAIELFQIFGVNQEGTLLIKILF
jgi:hypothetical protein